MRTPAVILAAAVGLAGCGGGGESTTEATSSAIQPAIATSSTTSTPPTTNQEAGHAPAGPSDEAAIEKNAATVIAGDNPALCTNLATERYVSETYGDSQGCLTATRSAPSAEVRVSHVEVAGDNATARAVPVSGPNAGVTISVSLIFDAGLWKVDSAHSNVAPGP